MNTNHWWHEATFYSIYPLGACGAPEKNDGAEVSSRLAVLTADLDRIQALGFRAVYLGPVFESDTHGYDTRDYFHVDRRLGTDDDLADYAAEAHRRGIKIVLDGVYNHVGRGFWAFKRLKEEGAGSEFVDWFSGVDFSKDNPFGDGFVYDGWEGVEELVLLNHGNAAVREHLVDAAIHAAERYGIDGIRLDVAYSLPFEFLDALSKALRDRRPGFWLLGEVIHGDYPAYLEEGRLQSVTNYECYKGLWSSFNDGNLHEIAHSLTRLFGEGGLLQDAFERGLLPFGFADNHDVSRLASILERPNHIYPLYALLWTMPGIPSAYYGSEYGIEGTKEQGDVSLRPPLPAVQHAADDPEKAGIGSFIRQLNHLRSQSRALRVGRYRQVSVSSTALVFERSTAEETVLVAVSGDRDPLTIDLPARLHGSYECLFGGSDVDVTGDRSVVEVPANGARILRRR